MFGLCGDQDDRFRLPHGQNRGGSKMCVAWFLPKAVLSKLPSANATTSQAGSTFSSAPFR